MIINCTGAGTTEGFIRHRSIDKLFADLLDWFGHCESDPIDGVSAAMVFLDTKCPSHQGSNLRPGITYREMLMFSPHTGEQHNTINFTYSLLAILLRASNGKTTSSFTSYIFR